MTKIEYIDFIRNSLSMMDKTAKFHREQVSAAINFAINSVFYDMFLKGDKSVRKSMERYSTLVLISPAINANTNRYTADLTIDVVDLPAVTGGILEVIRTLVNAANTTTQFIPVSTMAGEHLFGSESSLPSNVIGFSHSGAREIEFWGMSGFNSLTIKHYARIIKQFRSCANTDNIVLPYGKHEQIVEVVRQYLGVIPPKDLVNNNTQSNG